MQNVSLGDSLHEMSETIFMGNNKKNIIDLLSAEFVESLVKVT